MVDPAPDASKRGWIVQLWNACWSALHTVQGYRIQYVSRPQCQGPLFPIFFFFLNLTLFKLEAESSGSGRRAPEVLIGLGSRRQESRIVRWSHREQFAPPYAGEQRDGVTERGVRNTEGGFVRGPEGHWHW